MTPFDRAEVMTLDLRLAAGAVGGAAAAAAAAGLPTRRLLVGAGEAYPAADYHWVDVPAAPRAQAFNYASAFLKAVRGWRDAGAGPVLYMEDDAEFLPGAFPLIHKAAAELRLAPGGWDCFFVGGNFTVLRPLRVAPHLLRLPYALDLHCVGFHPRCFGRLLDIVPSAEHTIDGVVAELIRRGDLTAYGVNPPQCYQLPGWSYNEGRHDDKRDRQVRVY